MDGLHTSQEATRIECDNRITGGILFQGNLSAVGGSANFSMIITLKSGNHILN
jgi:hypothetical protein